jgi:hypothetical protein
MSQYRLMRYQKWFRRQRILREHALIDEQGTPLFCHEGGKPIYGRIIDAELAGAKLADPERPLTPYRCSYCHLYHLTSKNVGSPSVTPVPRMATVARILMTYPEGWRGVPREALAPARWGGAQAGKRLKVTLKRMEERRLIRREEEGEWIVVLDWARLEELAVDGCPD